MVNQLVLKDRISELNALMSSHAGAIELKRVDETSGAVEIRFLALCTGCPYRPLTMTATIRPALLSVPGVTAVEAEGARISAEAEERLAALFGQSLPMAPQQMQRPLHPV